MKKSFTSIALFSLVVVATSFTTPENIVSFDIVNNMENPIDGGVSVGGGRKQDIFATQLASTANYRQPIDGGVSVGGGRKQDIFAAQVASTANYRQPIDGGVSVGGGRKQD